MKHSNNVSWKVVLSIFLLILIPVICYASYANGYQKALNKLDNPTTLEGENLTISENISDAGDLPVNGYNSNVSSERIDIPGYAKLSISADNPNIPLMNLDSNSVYFVYTIVEDGNVLLKTDAIPPNKQIDVNFYDLLNNKVGIHNTEFIIETFDIETLMQCNGATQDVEIIIE